MPRRAYRGAGRASSRERYQGRGVGQGKDLAAIPASCGRDVQLDAGGGIEAGVVDLDAGVVDLDTGA
jgi:hypothetical protein